MALFTRKSTAAATVTEAPAVDPALAALTGTYTIDPSHSSIGFTVRHAMVTNVRGSFGEHEGTLVVDGTNPANSSASIDVKIASIDTGIADRDGHLVSGDFFDAEKFPHMTFRSTKAEQAGRRGVPDHRRPDHQGRHAPARHRPGVQRLRHRRLRQRARRLRGQRRHPALRLGPDLERGAGDRRRDGQRQGEADLRHLRDQGRGPGGLTPRRPDTTGRRARPPGTQQRPAPGSPGDGARGASGATSQPSPRRAGRPSPARTRRTGPSPWRTPARCPCRRRRWRCPPSPTGPPCTAGRR